ncbi:MAG: tRNA (guanosine(37)-N1)-methyltransferase TrmD [Clostridia bacterium]|nr:tRNA (guanosine(37)-N1)-methyltransferase TrmD [Clostridia bacterium]
MIINVLTLFPEMYKVFDSSIIGKALEKQLFTLNITNIRDYSLDKHKRTDDYPYGGGVGMIMTPQPAHSAINAVDPEHKALRIYLSPKGKKLDQTKVVELSKYENILLFNGGYEGIDQRIIDLDIDEEISIGDYILTSGDYASLVLIDSIVRFVPGVLGKLDSTEDESFSNGLLEYAQYTRPEEFCGLKVPDVLLSGHHENIRKWREENSFQITKKNRPDLLKK